MTDTTTEPKTTKRSSRAVYTREAYAKIVEGYRRAPGNHQRAGEYAGVDRKTARKAWNEGWKAYPWAPPISKALAEEQDEARKRAAARVRAEDDAQAQLADRQRDASIKAQTEELALQSAARTAAIVMAKQTLDRKDLLGSLLDRLEEQAPTMKARDVASSIREVRRLLEGLPALAAKLTELGEHVRGEDRAAPVSVSVDVDRGPDDSMADLETAVDGFVRILSRGGPAAVFASDQVTWTVTPRLRTKVAELLDLVSDKKPAAPPALPPAAPPPLGLPSASDLYGDSHAKRPPPPTAPAEDDSGDVDADPDLEREDGPREGPESDGPTELREVVTTTTVSRTIRLPSGTLIEKK